MTALVQNQPVRKARRGKVQRVRSYGKPSWDDDSCDSSGTAGARACGGKRASVAGIGRMIVEQLECRRWISSWRSRSVGERIDHERA